MQEVLKEGGRTGSSVASRQRFRRLLVVFQVGMAVMLVIGAGLLIKSFWRLRQVDPGFRPQYVLAFNLTLPASKYSQPHQITGFYNQLLDGISNLPGVQAAAIAYDNPLQASYVDSFTIEGRPETETEQTPAANFNPVSWDYFRTAGLELVKGRLFTAQDDIDHPGAVIVNEAFARRYFPGEEPLGKRLGISPPAGSFNNRQRLSFEIVGITRDVKSAGLNAEAEPMYYVPAPQAPLQDMVVLVRTQSDPVTLVPALRNAVWAVDPNQPIDSINTMENLVANNIAQPRFNMLLMGLFGAVAVLLAAIGIYGLLAYAVTQRTHEIGIRMALGAERYHIFKLVIGQALTLTLAGIGIGLASAWALTRFLSGLLFGVSATDPLTFIAIPLLLAAVALLASYLPARRAIKVDPMVALRYE